MKLIFIHGSGGCKESWQYQTEHFDGAEALDLPGHPAGELCASIDGYVEWLHEYVSATGYTDLVICGHSLGGGIALLYGLKYPADVRGLICVGSGGRLRVHPMFLEGLEKAIAASETTTELTESSLNLVDRSLADIIARRMAENGLPAMLNDLRACDQFDIMERLAEIEIPLLAVCGTEDVMTPPKYAQFLADNMQNARTAIIPGGTHFVFAEKPAEVNRAIEDFLDGINA
jgi:pimeloyl-ACP methyl ester carboxylesterase